MKRFFLWAIGFMLLSSGLAAQTASPEVLGSAGTHQSTPTAQVSWTIGEPVTETYSSATNNLTQGFHQTKLTITSLEELPPEFALDVFPNPAGQDLNVRWTGQPLDMDLNLIDLHGRTVRNLTLSQVNLGQIDVSGISQGTYFLQVGLNNNHIQNYKVIVAR